LRGESPQRRLENLTPQDLDLSFTDSADPHAPNVGAQSAAMVYLAYTRTIPLTRCRLRCAGSTPSAWTTSSPAFPAC
jgi:hypothetical protein